MATKLDGLTIPITADPSGVDKGLSDAAKKVREFDKGAGGKGAAAPMPRDAIKTTAASMMAGQIAGGAIKSAMGGKMGAEGAFDMLGQFASMIPGPMGAIASTVVGVVGSIVSTIAAESEVMKKRAGEAFGSIISGSKNARQAIADVRLDTMTQGFQALARVQMEAQNENIFQRLATGGMNQIAANNMDANIAGIVNQANRTADLVRRLNSDPRMRAVLERTASERAVRQTGDTAEGLRAQAGTAGARTAAFLGGADAREAADAATRQNMVETTANQIRREGETRAQALARANQMLAAGLNQVAAAQQGLRAAAAGAEIGQSLAAGREELDLVERRVQYLQTARGITADMTQEQAALARLEREGASPQVVQARRQQLDALQNARVRQEAAQQGRALREQMRAPMEVYQEEIERLTQLRQNGAIDETTFRRAQGRAMDQMVAAAGEAPVGQAALMEGSAAAASAILRAQRQQQREDPQARMLQATAELRAIQQQQREIQQRQLELLNSGRVFRAINGI